MNGVVVITMSNILIVGDSLSHENGFHDPTGKLWLDVFASRHNITNLSVGGQGDPKIFVKALKELIVKDFDLVIIQWRSIFRLNFNFSKSIYDNQQSVGTRHYSAAELGPLRKIWLKHCLHGRIEITEALTLIQGLSEILNQRKIPYIFIKTFDNYFSDLQKENWQDCGADYLDNVLFRRQLPDWEIKKFHLEMRQLYLLVKNYSGKNWLNLDQLAWVVQMSDYADDGLHPGIESCKKFGNDVVEFAKTLEINL
jgi:hypothetical protein